MGNDGIFSRENMYFKARKNAAMYNDRLCSREGAAEQLGLSASTLADYELGITKVVPVDKVVLMSDLYHCPEIKRSYCKGECPIGRDLPIATEGISLDHSILKFIKNFKPETLLKLKDKFLEIVEDGEIDRSEKIELADIIDELDRMAIVLSETRLMCQKAVEDGHNY